MSEIMQEKTTNFVHIDQKRDTSRRKTTNLSFLKKRFCSCFVLKTARPTNYCSACSFHRGSVATCQQTTVQLPRFPRRRVCFSHGLTMCKLFVTPHTDRVTDTGSMKRTVWVTSVWRIADLSSKHI